MMTLPINQRTVTLKLNRGQTCKLLIALTAIVQNDPANRTHYQKMHDEIKEQLEAQEQKWWKEAYS